MSTALSDPTDKKRRAVSKEDLRSLYDLLQKTYSKWNRDHGRAIEKERVYNPDEANIPLSGKAPVIVERGGGCNKPAGAGML